MNYSLLVNNKKFFSFFVAIIFVPFVLGGCFGGGSSVDGELVAGPGESIYSSGEFAILHPSDWHVLEQDTFPSLVPHQTVLAFRNNIQNEVFTANVNISKINVESNITADDFSKSTLAKIKTTLLSVTEISSTKINNGVLIHFQGKKSPSEPIINFKSLTVIQEQEAYTVTGAYLPTEDESVVIYIDKMLESFSLK
jgi:hypothetical protein